jgi:hypothetical protein
MATFGRHVQAVFHAAGNSPRAELSLSSPRSSTLGVEFESDTEGRMANGNDGTALGETVAALLLFIFSLTFPIIILTLCGISYLLAFVFNAPEFGLWAVLAMGALDYAKTNLWVAVAIVAFALAALPLAWVALREQETKLSSTILAYVLTGMTSGFVIWLDTNWSYDGDGWQIIAYGILLLFICSLIVEGALGTIGIVVHVRRNRSPPATPPPRDPHGARQGHRREQDEPETI